MAKTVNTSPRSKAHATLPLLERLRRVLERFMQSQKHTKKTKNKGLLALLQLLRQYSTGMVHMPVFSVPLPALGAVPHVLLPTTGGMVSASPIKQSARVPYVLEVFQNKVRKHIFSQGVLQNTVPVSWRAVLAASTAQPEAESSIQFAQARKPREYHIQHGADILARRPFFMLPRTALVRSSGRRVPVGVVAPAAMRVSASLKQVPMQQMQRPVEALKRKGDLHHSFVKNRSFQGIPVTKQLGRVALPSMPHAAVPVAHSMVGAFLPSSPLMQAAVQPVAPLVRPAPAAYVPQTPSSPFATSLPHPAPMPPRTAMQGLGGGDSATLAALSTLGSI